jgi:hypothetical protein
MIDELRKLHRQATLATIVWLVVFAIVTLLLILT